MADAEIHTSIEELVAEEHSLWEREAAGVATDHDRRRLEAVKVSLDQRRDLLRASRAARSWAASRRRRAAPAAGRRARRSSSAGHRQVRARSSVSRGGSGHQDDASSSRSQPAASAPAW